MSTKLPLSSRSPPSSPDSEEWIAFQATAATLREESEKLKSENLEVAERLGATTASQEALRSQVSSLREVNATRQDNANFLQSEFAVVKKKCD